MAGYPVGMIILIVLTILIYFGLTHRVLDRLRMSDKTALLVIGLLIVGSMINLPLLKGPPAVTVNVGGALVPLGLAVYLLIKAGTRKEIIRALAASAVSIGAVILVNRFVFAGDPWHAGTEIIDPLYLYPAIAALVAYLAGRSRRSAFVASILAMLSLDVVHYFQLTNSGIPGRVNMGGGGAFDAIILAGIIAVLLAEIIGEGRERLQGGPKSTGRPQELLKGLQGISQKPLPDDFRQEESSERGQHNDAE